MRVMSEEKNVDVRESASVDDSMRRVNVVETSNQITHFADEADRLELEVPFDSKKEVNPYVQQDLRDFLERPFPVTHLSWAKTDARGACLARLCFPDDLFNLPPIWRKLSNFQYMRAGLRIEIKVNATLYHYGKLLGVWRPMAVGKTTSDYGTGTVVPGCYDNLFSLSSFPHVIVSPNSTQTMSMEIGFALPTIWIDLREFTGVNGISLRKVMNMGVFELWVLNPLQAMGAANDPASQVTVYANFTNVELAGYTATDFAYQHQTLPGFSRVDLPTGFFRAQSGKEPVEAAHNTCGHPGIFKATIFPTQLVDAHSQPPAISMSMSRSNQHRPMLAVTDSLREYLEVPSLLRQEQITSLMTVGQTIATLPVTPYYFPTNNALMSGVQFRTRLAYVAALCGYWRGTLKYQFQVVCSKFHSMRLRVYWTPSRGAGEPGLVGISNTVNRVVDIQGETDFEVEVPWLSRFPLQVNRADGAAINGLLKVDILNTLVYPESQIPSIWLNIWVSAGPDFELGRLIPWFDDGDTMAARRITDGSNFVPIPTPAAAGIKVDTGRENESEDTGGQIKAQAGMEPPQDEGSRVIAGSSLADYSMEAMIGESFTKFSDFVSKPTPFELLTNTSLQYTPLVLQRSTYNQALTYKFNSTLEYLSFLFVGNSGSIRFYSTSDALMLACPLTQSGWGRTYTNGGLQMNDFLMRYGPSYATYFDPINMGGTWRVVELPFFSNLLLRYTIVNPSKISADYSVCVPSMRLSIGTTAGDSAAVFMAAGRDFGFHIPIGPPALLVGTT